MCVVKLLLICEVFTELNYFDLCFVTIYCLLLSIQNMYKIVFFLEDTTMEFPEIKDRIAHIIRAKNLTAAEFAIRLGIQPSNISHLLSGRNNPSLDFVKKLKETFPEYNLDWIIFGRGPMTVSEPFLEPAPVTAPQHPMHAVKDEGESKTLFDPLAQEPVEEHSSTYSDSLPKGIVLLFEDDTYRFLLPR